MYPNAFYRVSAKAVIKDLAGNVLVIKESQSTWSLPGGGVDHGEDPETALRRELEEELGIIDAGDVRFRKVLSVELPNKQVWLLWIVYDVTLKTQHFTRGVGVSEAQYIDPVSLHSSDDVFEKLVRDAAASL